jgi:hypothetical protein
MVLPSLFSSIIGVSCFNQWLYFGFHNKWNYNCDKLPRASKWKKIAEIEQSYEDRQKEAEKWIQKSEINCRKKFWSALKVF